MSIFLSLKKLVVNNIAFIIIVLLFSIVFFLPALYSIKGISFSMKEVPFELPKSVLKIPTSGLICWRHQKSPFFGKVEYIAYVEEKSMELFLQQINFLDNYESWKKKSRGPFYRANLFSEIDIEFIYLTSIPSDSEEEAVIISYNHEKEIMLMVSRMQEYKDN